MPRQNLIRSNLYPYHVTSRCMNKEFFPLPIEEIWEIMMKALKKTYDAYQIKVHGFVLMGNHFHLICETPHANLDEAMSLFLRTSSHLISLASGKRPPIWEGRYRWSLIENRGHYYQVYRYIFQNPLRANIVDKVENYKFSTLNSELPIPLHSNLPIAKGGKEGEIKWLNEKFESGAQAIIKKGLKHALFDINKKKISLIKKLDFPFDQS